ncbi:MAG: zinc ribbon domain-containing protein [Balneolales bacterium]|nr:zinc ribbon domain-containing protein [Balneolales bacterium]
MPTYLYEREDGTRFDFFQKMSDDSLKSCPETGQKVRRVITGGSGVIYKGTCFYNTDYKKPASKPEKANPENKTPKESNSNTKAADSD